MKISDILTYDESLLDPTLPTGLWFCDNAIEVDAASNPNAVCLGIGKDYAGLEKFLEWFSQFRYILIVSGDEEKRTNAETELRNRLSGTTMLSARNFKGCKSITELRDKYGIVNGVDKLLQGAVELPVYGLLNIAKVTPLDVTRMPRVLSGFTSLDEATGGFLFGDTTVWSGKRGEGKSTVLGQTLLGSIHQGFAVCAYSGELRAERFKDWLYLQAAGPVNLYEAKDQSGRTWSRVPAQVIRAIDEWLDEKFFLYDIKIAAAHDEDKIMSIFEYAFRRYGCRVFSIDNLMTTNLKRMNEKDYFRAQANFIGRCESFAKANNVHMHIVAHPKKKDDVSDADDIGGSGDIGNWADNIITIKRLTDSQVKENGYDAGLTLLKSRWTGDRAKIALKYEKKSHRYYGIQGNPNWRFGWDTMSQTVITDLPDDTDLPF